MNIENVTFEERAERSHYIATRFNRYLIGSVLDIGCDQAVLKGLLKDVNYIGIDIGGTPDLQINLDKIEKLPFDDNFFNTSICSDVLEHLDNLHLIFGEIVRISKKHIIISLPNNWSNARKPIERGKGSFSHYGLPALRPVDRHKWFFGLSEAINFLKEQEKLYRLSIVEIVVNIKPRPSITNLVRRVRYPAIERYLNRYAHTVWAVFEKSEK